MMGLLSRTQFISLHEPPPSVMFVAYHVDIVISRLYFWASCLIVPVVYRRCAKVAIRYVVRF